MSQEQGVLGVNSWRRNALVALPLLPLALHHYGLIGSGYFAVFESALALAALLVLCLRMTASGMPRTELQPIE